MNDGHLADLLAELDEAERAYFEAPVDSMETVLALRERWIEASTRVSTYVSANRDMFERRREIAAP